MAFKLHLDADGRKVFILVEAIEMVREISPPKTGIGISGTTGLCSVIVAGQTVAIQYKNTIEQTFPELNLPSPLPATTEASEETTAAPPASVRHGRR